MEIVVIIPARGGSRGIPQKNISLLNNKPLITYTIEAAFKAEVAKDIFVSTDSGSIAEVAEQCGARIINRPERISHDTASTESALIHALETIKAEQHCLPDAVLTLPPTSPLRSSTTIKHFVSYYISIADEYDAMISLTESHADYWIKDADGLFKRLFPDAPRRRQDRDPVFIENSALYITATNSLINTESVLGKKCTGFVIDSREAVDINEPCDLELAEFLIRNPLKK